MGPPSYIRSVVDGNVVMRRISASVLNVLDFSVQSVDISQQRAQVHISPL